MNIKKIKVYHLFWIVSAIIVIIGLIQINYPDSTVDINIDDTYLVIANSHLAVLLSVSYFLMGFGYWLIQKILKKPLVKYLTIIHCVILIGSFIFY